MLCLVYSKVIQIRIYIYMCIMYIHICVICMQVKLLVISVVSACLQSHGLKSTSLLYPWNSPGKNTELVHHSLLQRTQSLPASESFPMSQLFA